MFDITTRDIKYFGFKAVRALWASKRYLAKKAERKAKRAAKKTAKANKA